SCARQRAPLGAEIARGRCHTRFCSPPRERPTSTSCQAPARSRTRAPTLATCPPGCPGSTSRGRRWPSTSSRPSSSRGFEDDQRNLAFGLGLVAGVVRPHLGGLRPPLLLLLALRDPRGVVAQLGAVLQAHVRVGDHVVVPDGVL